MEQLAMRLGIKTPPAPYPVQFERRENNSYYRQALRDMPGVGAPAKAVLDIYSEVLAEDESGDWECAACGGSGEGRFDGSVCAECRGTGGSY